MRSKSETLIEQIFEKMVLNYYHVINIFFALENQGSWYNETSVMMQQNTNMIYRINMSAKLSVTSGINASVSDKHTEHLTQWGQPILFISLWSAVSKVIVIMSLYPSYQLQPTKIHRALEQYHSMGFSAAEALHKSLYYFISYAAR